MSAHRIYFHLAWTTRDRAPMIDATTRGGSSYAASRLPGNILGLRWAREYSATTVGPNHLEAVMTYIEGVCSAGTMPKHA